MENSSGAATVGRYANDDDIEEINDAFSAVWSMIMEMHLGIKKEWFYGDWTNMHKLLYILLILIFINVSGIQ